MQAMISGTFPESICSACRTGQTHSLRIHAKILLAWVDTHEPEAPATIQQEQPQARTSDPSYRVPRPTPPPVMPPQGDADALDGDELDTLLQAPAPRVVPIRPAPVVQLAPPPVVRVARPAAVVY